MYHFDSKLGEEYPVKPPTSPPQIGIPEIPKDRHI